MSVSSTDTSSQILSPPSETHLFYFLPNVLKVKRLLGYKQRGVKLQKMWRSNIDWKSRNWKFHVNFVAKHKLLSVVLSTFQPEERNRERRWKVYSLSIKMARMTSGFVAKSWLWPGEVPSSCQTKPQQQKTIKWKRKSVFYFTRLWKSRVSGADAAPLLRQTGSLGCARLRGSEVPSWKSKSHRLDSFPPWKAAPTTKWPWKRLEQHDDPSDGCSLDDWFQSVYWLFMGCQVHQVQQVHHVQQMHEVLQVL